MASLEGPPATESREQTPDSDRGQQVLALLQDIKDPENLKTLKTMMGNRLMNEFLSVLKDVYEAHKQLVNELHTLKIKHHNL